MTVVTTAWIAAGCPLARPPSISGGCARCGAVAALVPTGQVISRHLGREGWVDPCGAGVCPACTWSYRQPALRAVPHLICRHPPALAALTRPALAQALSRAVPADQALTVPTRMARKHLLPQAAWGRVFYDNAGLPWSGQDAARLGLLARLRALGVGAGEFTSPAPPYRVLRAHPAPARQEIQHAWGELTGWRDRPIWLHLALTATTPERDPHE